MVENYLHKRLEIELMRGSNQIFTPWQIQDFISKFASNYYKLDLLNAISNKLNDCTLQENIFIIDNSFNYDNHYSFLGRSNKLKLNSDEGLKSFYHFGNPVSMLPNKDIFEINTKFKFFRELNKYLGSKLLDKIEKSSLRILMVQGNNSIRKIYNLAMSKVQEAKDGKRERYVKDLSEIKEKYEKMLKDYSENEVLIDILKEKINNNDKIQDDDVNNVEIEKKYFKEFYKYFSRLERPIVGVYSSETNEIELLGTSFIYKKSRDERFLDIKEISHKSPPYCHLFIGVSFVVPTIVILKNILDSNKKKISKSRNMEMIETLEQNNEYIDENIKKLENLIEQENLMAHNGIENKYANENIRSIHSDIVNKSTENIKKSGFQNNNFKNKIINFEEYKK